MSAGALRHARKARRRASAKLRDPRAVRAHMEPAGRTGAVWEKRTHGKAPNRARVFRYERVDGQWRLVEAT